MTDHYDKGEDSVGHDFNTLMALVNPSEASYILFRKDDNPQGSWLFIVFIPDKAKVSDKLVYAASTLGLKKALGIDHFSTETLNYAVLSDFSWATYSAAGPSRDDCLNEREKHIQELDKMEAQARVEQEEDARAKAQRTLPTPAPKAQQQQQQQKPGVQRNAFTGAPRALPVRGGGNVGSLTKAFETGEANGCNSSYAVSGGGGSGGYYGGAGNRLNGECGMRTDCIGGYHTVRLPFKKDASDALDALAAGSVSVVSLKIDDEHVCLAASATVSAAQVASYLDEVEPRFVLYKDGPSAGK